MARIEDEKATMVQPKADAVAADEAAAKAQVEALTSGQRQSWRGASGAFGFVEPKPAAGGGCRDYSHTIFIAGRPRSGQGSACPATGGAWTFTG